MKSSTIGRSMLSKESMDVIENLSNDEYMYEEIDEDVQNPEVEDAPDEYLRSESDERNSKSKEIDLLWQTFKTSQFNTNSPVVYVIDGFILGVIVTLAIMMLLGSFGVKPKIEYSDKLSAPVETSAKIDVPTEAILESGVVAAEEDNEPAQEENTVSGTAAQEKQTESAEAPVMKKYVIKDGDTVEAIIKHHYGSYTPERAQNIMKANNLSNLDRISIGQVLLLPVEK